MSNAELEKKSEVKNQKKNKKVSEKDRDSSAEFLSSNKDRLTKKQVETLLRHLDRTEREIIPFLVYSKNRIIKEIDLFKKGKEYYIKKNDLFDIIKENDVSVDIGLKNQSFFNEEYLLLKRSHSYNDKTITLIEDEFKVLLSNNKKIKESIDFSKLAKFGNDEEFLGTRAEQSNFTISNDILFRQNMEYSEVNKEIYGTSLIPNYNLAINSTANFLDFILQYNKAYFSNGASGFEYFQTRRNFESIKSTVAVGDLNAQNNSFANFSMIGRFTGVSLFNNEILDPTRNLNVTVDGKFLIKNRSNVEFLNKESVFYSSIFQPGEYSILDIPVPYYSVDQKIKITDQVTGEITYVQLAEGFYSNRTTREDKVKYNLSYGKTEAGNIEFASGFFEKGLNSFSSASIAGRSDFRNHILDAGYSIDLKNFSSNLVFSHDFTGKANAYYLNLYPKIESDLFRFNLFLNRFDENYGIIGRTNQSEVRTNFGVLKSLRLKNRDVVSFRLNHIASAELSDRYSYSLSYSKYLRNGNIILTYGSGSFDESIVSLGASFKLGKDSSTSVGLSERRSRVNLSHKGEESQTQLEYNKDQSNEVVALNRSENYGFLSTNVGNSYMSRSKTNVFSVSGSSSIVFSDGRFSLSRPLNGTSFLLVSSDEDVDFSINGKNKSILSDIVYPVSSYKNESVVISNQTEDETISIKEDNFKYRLSEASSSRIKLETKRERIIRGFLVSKNGIPMKLFAGKAFINKKEHEFITDSDGGFEIATKEDEVGGTEIKIILGTYPNKSVIFKLEEDKKPIYDIDDVTFPLILKDK